MAKEIIDYLRDMESQARIKDKKSKFSYRKIIKKFPNVLNYKVSHIQELIDCFAGYGFNGFNYYKMISLYPGVLGCTPKRIFLALKNLEEHGINSFKTVEKCPWVLNYAIERTNGIIQKLDAYWLDSKRIIDRYPTVLCCTKERTTDVIKNFKKNDLNYAKIINKCPMLLGYSTERTQRGIDTLLSFTNKKEIENNPSALITSAVTMQNRMKYLLDYNIEITFNKLICSAKYFEDHYYASADVIQQYTVNHEANKKLILFMAKLDTAKEDKVEKVYDALSNIYNGVDTDNSENIEEHVLTSEKILQLKKYTKLVLNQEQPDVEVNVDMEVA